jgi:tetratricopeptide (TPR) repeat protein
MKLSGALSKVDRDEEALDCLLDASTLRKHGGFDMSLGSVDASIHFASLLNMLVSVVDSRDKVFEACREVVAILRPLASQCPSGHEHNKELSRALYKLAACHADRRQFDAALEVFQEASNMRGDLPAGGSVANSLHDLAATLANLGRYSEALGVIRECVGVRRNIYADDPTEGRPFVASLNTYSHILSELGGLRESVDIIQEAIYTLQVIASTDPMDSRSLLATCYVTKGHRYRQMEQYAPALEAYQAGLDLRQALSSDDPDEISKLCTALTGISISQMRLGQYEEAIHSSEQAVDYLRTLDNILPGVYAHDLATALSDLAHVLHATGREAEALAACREAATLYERLAIDLEDLVYQEHYSSCLSNLSVYLGQQGSYQEAYEASEKAVSIKRMLANSSASVDRTDVAKAIAMMASHLQHLGSREEEAVGALLEANEIFREASQVDPSNLRYLATGLNNINVMLMKMGEAEEAFCAIQEAIHIYRDLFHDQPQIHGSHLANSLFNYTVDCVSYCERENALTSLNEALAIRRELAHRWPAAHLSTFVNLIQKAKGLFEMMGQPETNEQLEGELAILLSSSCP